MRKQHEQQSNTTTGAAIHSISPPEQAGNAQEHASTQNHLTLTLPGPGEQVTLQVSQGALLLDFDVSTALFARTGDDLTLESVDGGKITLGGYFAVNGGVILPPFVLPDGTIVPAAGFLRAQAPELDISTATGNAPNNRTYTPSYEANELLEGVDRLGSLGTNWWGHGVKTKLVNIETATSLLQSKNSPTPAPQLVDDDTIKVNSSGHLSDIFIFGDSIEQAPAPTRWGFDEEGYWVPDENMVRFSLANTPGADTLSLTLPGENNEQGYIAGGNIGGKQVYGNDSITVNALSLSNAKVDGGLGNDTIILNTTLIESTVAGDSVYSMAASQQGGDDIITVETISTGRVFGDTAAAMHGSTRGGNDTITVTSMEYCVIAGDAGNEMSGEAIGGNDSITVGTVNYGTIGGDTEYYMEDRTIGGNDTITITIMTGGTVGGDAVWDMTGYSRGGDDSISVSALDGGDVAGDGAYYMVGQAIGGDDTITVTTMDDGTVGGDGGYQMEGDTQGGDDSIAVTTLNNGYISGDATRYLAGNARGGNDTITITTMNNGEVSGDGDVTMDDAHGGSDHLYIHTMNGGYVGGDSWLLLDNTRGGDDTITVTTMNEGSVGGDGAVSMNQNAQGGNDSITIGSLSGSFSYIGGDSGEHMNLTAQGGNDTITVTTMNDGFVGGDAGVGMHNNTRGGNDTITVETMNGGFVSGDSGGRLTDDVQGGDDSITVGLLAGGAISGDACVFGLEWTEIINDNPTGGHDTIHVTTMTAGAIYGDAEYVINQITAGNDSIHVGTMSGGSIYGDTGDGRGEGNDTITIDHLEGSAAKTIDGGGGNDLFVYNNDADHTLGLNEAGQVSIDGNAYYANTTITGFEGLGGGSGNDTLTGNSGNNILVGGAGHDVLTGGAGADTFVWKLGHQGTEDAPATDVVTDFNVGEGDKLDLSQLLGGGAQDHLDDHLADYLSIIREGSNTVLQISTAGHGAEGHFDQIIVLENTSLTDDQLMQQLILQISS